MLLGHLAQAQTLLTGRVTNAAGAPLSGASVGVQGTNVGTDTDSNGDYTLTLSQGGTYVVGVRLLGYLNQEHRMTVKAGEKQTRNFILVPGDRQLEEVTVQGDRTNKFSRKSSEYVGKMPLSNLENPQVYATVGKELLTEQLVFSVDDATRNVPGLQKMWPATGRSGDGGAYYNSRGFYFQSQLRNGVAGNVTNSIDAANLEKLEVIKGPSATLYGSSLSTYGGLINRVTKKAYDHFGGEVTYSAGSFAFNRLSLDINTPLTKDNKLLFRLNAAANYEDSWQNRGYTGFDKSIAVAPTLTYRPTDRLTINLDAEIARGRNVGKQINFIDYLTSPNALGIHRADEFGLDYRQSYIGPGLTQDSRSTNYFGQVNYQIAPGFTSSTNFTHSRSYSDGFGAFLYIDGTGVRQSDQSTQDSRQNLTEVQQLFNGDFAIGSLRNRVVVGLDYLRIVNDQTFVSFRGATLRPYGLGDRAYTDFTGDAVRDTYANITVTPYLAMNSINTYSAFASDVLNLTEKLSVLAALRIDRFNNQGSAANSANAYKQTALSPKFGLVFQPVLNRVSLFANYQNSFRNVGSFQNTQGQNILGKPEQANQVEAGVKLDAADGRISATVSYYNIRVRNLLRATPVDSTVATPVAYPFANTQNGTQVSNGVELNVVANPVPGLNLVAGFAYNDSELTRTTANDEGRRPSTASSPYLANLWVSYRLTNGVAKGLGLGAGGNYASDNKVINSVSQGVFILPCYTVLNASLFYDQPKYRLGVKVDNLTNEHYWIGYGSLAPQKVRSIIGSVAYKF
ncbi:TonB-dependent receptor [Hymenobacter profundi]|uniref:TonB-dependent receptor n=1 Tax=Hymenobacter profundi TaxID=1982110 RepID=A0ABS6WZ80_9BACT|nr:TonB-dependent receptor [Hymenobacter profundi]MBW3128904.1 TonB-dependent receptor [Hymenobacter profundi]